MHITDDERLKVLQTDGVLNFVHYLNKPAIIRDEEIELIKSFLLEKDALISAQSLRGFKEDDKVIIKHGLFMDNTGTVLRSTANKVYIKLESLQQVMIVEFPAKYVVHHQ